MIGRIHSFDTFGTLDGPGIRFVLFMQGCPLRCLYCHNPDTWDSRTGKRMTVEEVLAEIEPFVRYYTASGGGITVSGGEPTVQAPFVAELFRECKKRWNLHTALDTSGYSEPAFADDLLDQTDLVLLDLKEFDTVRHKALTGRSNDRIFRFSRHLSERGMKMWIRFVLVPELTDSMHSLLELGRWIGELRHVEKVEVLPYHRMGVYKWQQIGRPYPLEGYREPTQKEVERAIYLIEEGRKAAAV